MPMESDVQIGFRLKAARERSGLTQQQLADALGVRHRQTVASIEAGDRPLSAAELILGMQVLGVDLDYFTDPFRLVGEGQFSFRTSATVEEQVLDQFERRAGRWIAMYRELSREQGPCTPLARLQAEHERALLLRRRPGRRARRPPISGSWESVPQSAFGPSWRIGSTSWSCTSIPPLGYRARLPGCRD